MADIDAAAAEIVLVVHWIVHGSAVDSYIWATANSGAVGLNSVIEVDGNGGGTPLNTSATLWKNTAMTVTTGFDFNPVTFSENVL